MALARFDRDVSIGSDQRKLALERLLHGEEDAQRRALPRRDRRGEHRDCGILAGAGAGLGLRFHLAQDEDEKCTCVSDNAVAAAAKRRAVNTGIPFPGGGNHIAKALAESWQTRRSGDASFAPLGPAPRAVRPAIFACDDQSGGGLPGRGGFGPKARAGVFRCGRLVLDRASCRAVFPSPPVPCIAGS